MIDFGTLLTLNVVVIIKNLCLYDTLIYLLKFIRGLMIIQIIWYKRNITNVWA